MAPTFQPARPEVLAFMEDIKTNPDDDTPRLILADWLTDQGDPRGDFIRLQVQSSRLSPDSPKRQTMEHEAEGLLKEHRREWLGPLERVAKWTAFQRGLVLLGGKPSQLLDPALEEHRDCEAFSWLETMRLSFGAEEIELLHEVLRGPLLMKEVIWLDLRSNGFDEATFLFFANAPISRYLHTLDLRDNSLGNHGVVLLAQSRRFHTLRHLILDDNGIGGPGGEALADSKNLANLECLALMRNRLSRTARRKLERRYGKKVWF